VTGTSVATRPDVGTIERPRDQVELIKDTIARDQNLTDVEFKLFLYTADRLGLDPLAKQIYAVRRKGKLSFQTGIDGFRLVAARTKEYAGSDDPAFENDGQSLPEKATVTVWRFVQGQRCAFTASARWVEYYPGDGPESFMWRKMPHTMLGKCAEALALRKAFPAELSGLYSDDEMDQAGRGEASAPKAERSAQPPRQAAPPTPTGLNTGAILIVSVGDGRWLAQDGTRKTVQEKEILKSFGFRWDAEAKVWGTSDPAAAEDAAKHYGAEPADAPAS